MFSCMDIDINIDEEGMQEHAALTYMLWHHDCERSIETLSVRLF
jgi:hypothetical protein